jgi:hypothetical protein
MSVDIDELSAQFEHMVALWPTVCAHEQCASLSLGCVRPLLLFVPVLTDAPMVRFHRRPTHPLFIQLQIVGNFVTFDESRDALACVSTYWELAACTSVPCNATASAPTTIAVQCFEDYLQSSYSRVDVIMFRDADPRILQEYVRY